MSDIKELHEQTGKIIYLQDIIESYKSKLESLRATQVVHAELTIEINRNKRSSSRVWLTAKEVEDILYTRLREAEGELVKLQAEFNAS